MLLTTFDDTAPRVVGTDGVLQLRRLLGQKQIVELDTDPAGPREAAGVPGQPIADVEHRRCPRPRSSGPLPVGRPRPPVVVHQRRRPFGITTLQQQQARGGVPQSAAHGEDITHTGP